MIPEYFRPKTEPAQVWAEYTKAKMFNDSIDLYETVKKNERFVSGDQWAGVKAPDMDKPVLNFLNRAIMYQVALIVSDNIGVSITHQQDDDSISNRAVANYLESQVDKAFEDSSFSSKSRECLRDAAVAGDACLYAYWDWDKDKPVIETVDNTSVLFGNPNVSDVQDQPYIIIEQAKDLKDVKWQAYTAGVEEWETITADTDLESRQSDSPYNGISTCTVLKKFWRDLETGTIWYTECTRTVQLREPIDTELDLYPIAWMNWEKVKESYHGKAIVTGYIDNQIAVNRLWAGALYHLRMLAFPKVFYDKSKLGRWDNQPGAAYGVAGGLTDAVASAFQAPKMDSDVVDIVDKTVSMTRDFMGVNDVVLGNINPSNTSAIIAVQKSTAAPLELQRLAYYQFVEDIVRVLLDLMMHNLGKRDVKLKLNTPDPVTGQMFQQDAVMIVDFGMLTMDTMSLKVDVGEAAYWSELTQVQTMDNLFQKGLMGADTYLDSIPDKLLPNKGEIIEAYKNATMQGQMSVASTEDLGAAAIGADGLEPTTRAGKYEKNMEERMDAQMSSL